MLVQRQAGSGVLHAVPANDEMVQVMAHEGRPVVFVLPVPVATDD